MIYSLAALGAIGTTAYLVSVALTEQFTKTGTFPLISNCIAALHADPRVTARLTPPIFSSAHPPTNYDNNGKSFMRNRRSHPVVKTNVNQRGEEVSSCDFFVESNNGIYAQVHFQAVEGTLTLLQIHFPQESQPITIINNNAQTKSSLLSKYFGIF